MPALSDIIDDTFPGSGDVGVPLQSAITVLFDRAMDHTELQLDFFIEGPDTDQFIGPGLLELTSPANISQGDLDNFLRSPGYAGLVQGVFTFKYISLTDVNVEVDPNVTSYRSKLVFTPDQPLHPSLIYTVNIAETKDDAGAACTGHVSFNFESGTGSITELPSTISTSILSSGATPSTATSQSTGVLKLISSTPADYSIDNASDLSEIVFTFDKELDSSTITDASVILEAKKVSDHPNIVSSAKGKLAKELVVSGKTLTIKI